MSSDSEDATVTMDCIHFVANSCARDRTLAVDSNSTSALRLSWLCRRRSWSSCGAREARLFDEDRRRDDRSERTCRRAAMTLLAMWLKFQVAEKERASSSSLLASSIC